MHRVAVFVDAGYLFAQGSAALEGSRRPRASLTLNAAVVLNELRALAIEKAPNCSILRIYWYDGALGGARPTADQALIAEQDDVKLRLGFINSAGQQKGVDSLIVTDLIELARQKAICDALLVSGDEDTRVGVQIAQNYGVRIHLLGLEPSRANQAVQLRQEADTTCEWKRAKIATFLSVRSPTQISDAPAAPSQHAGYDPELERAAHEFVRALQQADCDGLAAYWRSGERGISSDLDRRLLPHCRQKIGQDLDQTQKRFVRAQVASLIKIRLDQ